MSETSKGKSPFYPGQPVPLDLFVGRTAQIDRIMTRGAGQVALGKPAAFFIEGDYGIGKSSFANLTQRLAEVECGLHPIYVPLGGAKDLADVGAAILEGIVRSGRSQESRGARIRHWLARYVGKQTLFGLTVNLEALRADAPQVSSPTGLLAFLGQTHGQLAETGVRGIFLVLDEINGITADPAFAQFIKTLVDVNALAPEPLPLLLMLCGVEDRRRDMIQRHPGVDRIFDVVQIEALSRPEMEQFFQAAFASAQLEVEPAALRLLTHYSAGFPKIMQVVGDSCYWANQDSIITEDDAFGGVFMAADEVGRKFVDQQVYNALRSADYRSTLDKIAQLSPSELAFRRSDVISGLTDSEKRKFDAFLRKMVALNVIRAGDTRGEYAFNLRIVRLYIWLQSFKNRLRSEVDP